jgi:hypothetical protein
MTKDEALAEMTLYLAGAIEQGQVDAALITGGMLRQLVDIARHVPGEVSIGDVWCAAHEVLGPAWKSAVSANSIARLDNKGR